MTHRLDLQDLAANLRGERPLDGPDGHTGTTSLARRDNRAVTHRDGQNGHEGYVPWQPGPPPVGAIQPSEYLRYLPGIYSADDFTGRFLRIFEDVLDPIAVMVDNMAAYFDPINAPPDLLDWLAMWVDMDGGTDWPLDRRRELIAAAVALYRMRGTKSSIKHHIGIYTGGLPLIMERTGGFRLDPDARLGLNTTIGNDRPQTFNVTIAVADPDSIDLDTLRGIIDDDKPVETAYTLRVVPLPALANGH
jgi:phage tail-like protein